MRSLFELKNKKIAIWGFGQEGKSVAKILQKYNIPFSIINDTQLKKNIVAQEILIGDNGVAQLNKFDLIIKSPGISLYRKEIQKATTIFTSATNIWFRFFRPKGKIIFVTGTKGKSTTASLLTYLINKLGKKAILAGNIGIPVLDLVGKEADVWIIELSSYQIADLKHTGDINILLNLYPEHLDWHISEQQYFHDKTNIFRNQKKGYNVIHNKLSSRYKCGKTIEFGCLNGFHVDKNIIYQCSEKLLNSKDISLEGMHNYENICAILTTIQLLDFSIKKTLPHLKTFISLPHRLQKITDINNIVYVSDSISTTPESTLAAIHTFLPKEITLLLGGQDRGLNWKKFAHQLSKLQIKHIITMYESGKHIHMHLEGKTNSLFFCETMAEAVLLAKKITKKGIILLSPAAPSYDVFDNFKQKGECFIQKCQNDF